MKVDIKKMFKSISMGYKKSIAWIKPIGIDIAKFFSMVWRNLSVFFEKFGQTKTYKVLCKIAPVIIVILAIAQFYFAISVYAYKSENKVVRAVASFAPYPIAIANQDFVTYGEYQQEKEYIHHFYNSTQQDGVDFKQIDQQILDQLIDNKIIAFQAIKYHTSVSKQAIDDAINGIINQNGGKDKVEKVLNDLYGLSLKDFRRLVKVQLTRDGINENVIARVTARHILIRVDADAAQDKVDAAKTKIDGILAEIKGGLDFGDAAKKYSEDTGSAEQGGLLDPFAKGEMVQQFSDVAFATKVGDISEPFRSDYGWHIVKVESHTGKIEMKFSDWLDGIKKKSLILKFY